MSANETLLLFFFNTAITTFLRDVNALHSFHLFKSQNIPCLHISQWINGLFHLCRYQQSALYLVGIIDMPTFRVLIFIFLSNKGLREFNRDKNLSLTPPWFSIALRGDTRPYLQWEVFRWQLKFFKQGHEECSGIAVVLGSFVLVPTDLWSPVKRPTSFYGFCWLVTNCLLHEREISISFFFSFIFFYLFFLFFIFYRRQGKNITSITNSICRVNLTCVFKGIS